MVPLLITLVLAALSIKNPPIIDGYIEALFVDYRFKIRNLFLPPPAPDNILIVVIDEKSLAEHGRWPWSRKLQAKLISKIFADQPKLVAVDIFHVEPESRDADKALSDEFRKHKDKLVVALGFDVEKARFFTGEIENILYENAITKIENQKEIRTAVANKVFLPPGPIAGSATFGHVYSLPDRDGKLRWENTYIKYGEEYFPSFAVQTARIAMGIAPDAMRVIGATGMELGNVLIPTDEFGRLHINYIGRERSIPYKSAADVLSGRMPEGLLRDKIILIGTSALSTYDLKNTPFSANMPGVEKNATVVANILTGDFIKKSPLFIDLFVLLLSGFLIMLAGNKLKALYAVIAFALLTALFIITNLAVFALFGIRTNTAYPLFTIIAGGIFIISNKYFIEEKRAKDTRKMFSSYVTERVVNELMKNPAMTKLGGERREITVLFSDIVGFTSLSENLRPEDVVAILNEYLAGMTDVIFKWEGTLDKFIGDAIVAFWGAPMHQENHAELATRCALQMIDRLEELRQKWQSEGKAPFDIGIGINTGEVLVGNIGADGKKMDYTVIGDHVNLCSRVESLTRKYKTRILITEYTLNEIRALVTGNVIKDVAIKGIDQVIVKGRGKPVKIYELKSAEAGAGSTITECQKESVVIMKEK